MSVPSQNARRLARFALNRLGYGPGPDSIDEVLGRGLERWIQDQLQPKPDTQIDSQLRNLTTLGWSLPEAVARYDADNGSVNQLYREFRVAHFARAAGSSNQLEEVLTEFWFNHFNVNAGEALVRVGLARYEYDDIRPRVLGKFRDLLGAVAHSWAMMYYLDNYLSTARRVNENYARELMELHTLGVDGGYTQTDVEEVTRAFTGWGIDRRAGTFSYRDNQHDQLAKTVLGQRLGANQGQRDGDQVLDIIAAHASTARFVSLKLARRFLADDPPASIVDRCADTYQSTSGDLAEVMRTLIGSAEFWSEAFGPGKIKTPHEYVVSALRALDADITSARPATDLGTMGMPTYEALDPTGWSDRGADWIPNPGSHLSRMNFVLGLVSQTQDGIAIDLRRLLGSTSPDDAGAVTDIVNQRLFSGELAPETVAACRRVTATGSLRPAFKVVGLALASPAFQVR